LIRSTFILAIALVASATSAAATQPTATVIYLTNLSIPRLGTESNADINKGLGGDGREVRTIDYAHRADAKSPALNADVLKLRQEIKAANPDRVFIVPEGFRLRQNVEFARDGERVLAMDIIYPAKPSKPVPVLMEISCDNVNRMGNGSLLFCHDTLLEGGAIAGFAVAMVDHPVPPPYKGIDDPMPQSLERMKQAVAKLRSLSKELGTTDKIGAIGFSRGGEFAAMLAAQGDVQAALIHGNRYDYLDLLDKDPMLARFEKAWGKRDDNRERWAMHGATHYLTPKAAPMFLNTSDTESPEYRHGLARFAERLDAIKVPHTLQLDHDGRGHRVTTDPKTLSTIYDFFRKHLELNAGS
jgi:hypothetical protein